MPTTQVTVHSLVNEVLAEQKLSDPHDIANEVYARIPHDCPWLQETLYLAVRHIIHDRGMRPASAAPAPQKKQQSSGRIPGPSRAQNLTQTALLTPRFIGKTTAGRSIWKQLKDCTAADLREMSNVRYAQAAANEAAAQRCEELAAQMDANGWTTVAQVPPAVLQALNFC